MELLFFSNKISKELHHGAAASTGCRNYRSRSGKAAIKASLHNLAHTEPREIAKVNLLNDTDSLVRSSKPHYCTTKDAMTSGGDRMGTSGAVLPRRSRGACSGTSLVLTSDQSPPLGSCDLLV